MLRKEPDIRLDTVDFHHEAKKPRSLTRQVLHCSAVCLFGGIVTVGATVNSTASAQVLPDPTEEVVLNYPLMMSALETVKDESAIELPFPSFVDEPEAERVDVVMTTAEEPVAVAEAEAVEAERFDVVVTTVEEPVAVAEAEAVEAERFDVVMTTADEPVAVAEAEAVEAEVFEAPISTVSPVNVERSSPLTQVKPAPLAPRLSHKISQGLAEGFSSLLNWDFAEAATEQEDLIELKRPEERLSAQISELMLTAVDEFITGKAGEKRDIARQHRLSRDADNRVLPNIEQAENTKIEPTKTESTKVEIAKSEPEAVEKETAVPVKPVIAEVDSPKPEHTQVELAYNKIEEIDLVESVSESEAQSVIPVFVTKFTEDTLPEPTKEIQLFAELETPQKASETERRNALRLADEIMLLAGVEGMDTDFSQREDDALRLAFEEIPVESMISDSKPTVVFKDSIKEDPLKKLVSAQEYELIKQHRAGVQKESQAYASLLDDLSTPETTEATQLSGPMVATQEPAGDADVGPLLAGTSLQQDVVDALVTVASKPVEPDAVTPEFKQSLTKLASNDLCLQRAFEGDSGFCQDKYLDNQLGPELVVLPSKEGRRPAFAITKYEVSQEEYNKFCLLTGNCQPEKKARMAYSDQKKHGDDQIKPVALELSDIEQSIDDYNRYCALSGRCDGVLPEQESRALGQSNQVTFEQAQAYASWLSTQTGQTYRLPTDDEWLYAVQAGSREFCQSLHFNASEGQTAMINDWGVVLTPQITQEWVQSQRMPALRGPVASSGGELGCGLAYNPAQEFAEGAQWSFRLVRQVL